MIKTIQEITTKLTIQIANPISSGIASILPFKETSCEGKAMGNAAPAGTENIGAFDLFSMFTADIIRQDVKFTR